MKKILLTALGFFAFFISNAQDIQFGVRGGILASAYDGYKLHKDDNEGIYDGYYYWGNGAYDSNESNVGVYAGATLDLELVDKFRIQPEFNITVVPGDSGYIALGVPVMVKYSFFDKFYALAGPALNYAVDGDEDQFSPSFNLGATYDVMENFYVEARADIGISGYLGSNINAGVGYRF
ncbi:outer membrane beta-barrel protein [Flavobacterium sp.]|uniref:outer membrane beta-barrel protein n=1 Tax=Flavobacterium sp. TaxID=239 RepID=UPI0039E53988